MENVSISPAPAGTLSDPAAVAAMLQAADTDLAKAEQAEPAGPSGPGACLPERTPTQAPAEPLSSHLAGSLKRRWRSYWQELRRCQKGFAEESVHELRVATRRLISELVLLEGVFKTAALHDAHRTLKRRLKRLGELRDIHVQRLFIEERLTRFPELLLLQEHLVRKEKRLEKEAARVVGKFKTARLQKQFRALVKMLERFADDARRESRLATAVRAAIDGAFEETVRRRRAISPADLKTVHRTRVAFKRFRYMVETIAATLPDCGAQKLRPLALYQRRMGDLQDVEVLEKSLADFIARHRGTATLLDAFARYLRRRKGRLLHQFLKAADQLDTFWRVESERQNRAT